jgi:hypothetical protein
MMTNVADNFITEVFGEDVIGGDSPDVTVFGDMGTGGAPSLPVEKPYVDQGPPLPEKFKKQLAEEMKKSSPTATPATAPSAPPSNFLTKNVPGLNLPAWQVALGGIGVLAIGVGIFSLVRPSKVSR